VKKPVALGDVEGGEKKITKRETTYSFIVVPQQSLRLDLLGVGFKRLFRRGLVMARYSDKWCGSP
jgi:hypothetical protein